MKKRYARVNKKPMSKKSIQKSNSNGAISDDELIFCVGLNPHKLFKLRKMQEKGAPKKKIHSMKRDIWNGWSAKRDKWLKEAKKTKGTISKKEEMIPYLMVPYFWNN